MHLKVVKKYCCHEGHDNSLVIMKDHIIRSQVSLMSSDFSEISQGRLLKGSRMNSILIQFQTTVYLKGNKETATVVIDLVT